MHTAMAHKVPAYRNASCFQGEPHVYEQVLRSWLEEEGVSVRTGQAAVSVAVQRPPSSNPGPAGTMVAAAAPTISSVQLEDGTVLGAAQLIDATYEGDLLALAGVPFAYGREARGEYNESFAGQGLCLDSRRDPQRLFLFAAPVDPFATPGAGQGPVLPGVDGVYPAWSNASAAATADRRVQAFNFRLCLTYSTTPGKAAPIPKPDSGSYDPRRYELLARYIAALNRTNHSFGLTSGCWGNSGKGDCAFACNMYVGGKCCTNDGGSLGIAPLGNETYEWSLSTPAQRRVLRQRFVDHTLGLFHFLATDPRVPATVTTAMKRFSLCADEWVDPALGHLPPTPYIREGRRLRAHDVFAQEDYRARSGVSAAIVPPGIPGIDPASSLGFSVGLGFWFLDSHPVRRVAAAGWLGSNVPARQRGSGPMLQNEGCLQSPRGSAGWEIPFGIMVPPNGSVVNLLVVCAPSATHVGFQALRVEPTFMTLGHAAGVAAALTVARQVPSPKTVGAAALQAALRRQGAILDRADMLPAPVNASCAASL